MPIRINLLAEAQVAEELRRRDPVKRVIFLGASFVALALAWSGMVEVNVMLASARLDEVQTKVDTFTNTYRGVLSNQEKINAIQAKLSALQKLTESRFLQGNLLNALQHATVEGVQLTRLSLQQSYVRTEGTKARTNGGRETPGRPATVRERIVLTLEARDYSANPGDRVNKFANAITQEPYFKKMLAKTNGVQLVSLSAPQTSPDGRRCVLFTLECHYPDQIRQ